MKLIIRNGHVIDATTDEKRDILVEGTHITGQRPEGELMEIDAEGCYVFPGLIDFHAHLFSEGSQVAVYPDSMIPNGGDNCYRCRDKRLQRFLRTACTDGAEPM